MKVYNVVETIDKYGKIIISKNEKLNELSKKIDKHLKVSYAVISYKKEKLNELNKEIDKYLKIYHKKSSLN